MNRTTLKFWALGSALLFATACNSIGGDDAGLIVSIDASATSGPGPLEVSFTAEVSNAAPAGLRYEWDFGDGSPISTETEPTHVYETEGTYTASVAVYEGDRAGSARKSIQVNFADVIDFAVTNVEVSPPKVNPGGSVSLKVGLANQGTVAVTGNIIVRLYVLPTEIFPESPGPPTGVINLAGLGAGETVEEVADAYVPPTADEQAFYAFAYVDGPVGNEYEEPNEENNVGRSVLPIVITDGPLPVDIVVDSITVEAGDTILAGDTVTVRTTLSNAGSQISGGFKLSHRLSVDPIITTNQDNVFGQNESVPPIESGGTMTVESVITVPMALDNRPYYLGAVADVHNDLLEEDETNNLGLYDQLILISGADGCTEDALEPNETPETAMVLTEGTLDDVVVCPNSNDWFLVDLVAGDALTTTINFSQADGDLNLRLYDAMTGDAIDTSISNGASEIVQSGLITADSTYAIKVESGATAEGVPYQIDVNIASSGGNGKDLVPASLVVAPENVAAGGAVNISVEVHNFGTDDAGMATSTRIFLSDDAVLDAGDTEIGMIPTADVPTGMFADLSEQVSVPANLADGTYWVLAISDADGLVEETFEDNNIAFAELNVGIGCLDDLFENNDSWENSLFTGSGKSAGLRVCYQDADFYELDIPAGGDLVVDALFKHAEGNINLRLRNDQGNTIQSTFSYNDNEHLEYNSAAGGTYYLEVYLSYDLGSTPGNDYDLQIDGAYSDVFDLSPAQGVTITPNTEVYAGDEIQVEFALRNLSYEDAPADFMVGFYVSDDANIDGGDQKVHEIAIGAMLAGAVDTYSIKFPLPDTVTAGEHYIGLFVDSWNSHDEGSELNNTAASLGTLVVHAPCTDDLFEENDNSAQAVPLDPNMWHENLMVCKGDEDWFRVDVLAGEQATFRIEMDALNDLDLYIYDEAGTLIASSITTGSDSEQLIETPTEDTTYLIRVKGFNGAVGSYRAEALK